MNSLILCWVGVILYAVMVVAKVASAYSLFEGNRRLIKRYDFESKKWVNVLRNVSSRLKRS